MLCYVASNAKKQILNSAVNYLRIKVLCKNGGKIVSCVVNHIKIKTEFSMKWGQNDFLFCGELFQN